MKYTARVLNQRERKGDINAMSKPNARQVPAQFVALFTQMLNFFFDTLFKFT